MTSRVVVAGGANIDVKVTTSGPTAGGISTPGRIHVVPGGVARNVAEALGRLGAGVSLLAVVGHDPWATWLMAETETAGVDTRFVLRRPGQTGFFVTIDGRGVADTAIVEGAPPDAWREVPVEDTDALVLDANLGGPVLGELTGRARRVALVGTSPAKVVRLRPLLQQTWLVCLTAEEARALLDGAPPASTGEGLARAVRRLGPAWVMLTEGGAGLGLLGESWTAVPAYPGPVLNATGAGDTAAAVVVFGLLRGWAPERLLPLAARAATMTLGVWGNVHPEVGIVVGEGRA